MRAKYSESCANEEVELPAGQELVTGDDSSNHEHDLDTSNLPLNLVSTQFAD